MEPVTEIVQRGKYLYGHFLNSTIKDGIDRYEPNASYSVAENGRNVRSGSGMKVLIVVLIVLILCAAAYFTYKYFKNKKDKKEDK